MSEVRIGVVGTGGMGKAHCRALKDCRRARLAGVTDAVMESAQAAGREFGVPVFPSVEALLDSGQVDAITIATPHWFHPDIAIAAFRRKSPLPCASPTPIA